MSRPRWAPLVLATLILSACATRPTTDASGCSNIQGLIGHEFRLGAESHAKVPLHEIDAGLNLAWTLPDVTRDFRQSLVMGDHLCHAAAAHLIDRGVYQAFIAKQVGAIGVLEVQSGEQSLAQARTNQAALAATLAASDSPALAGFDARAFTRDADPALGNAAAPFAPAAAIAQPALSTLPPFVDPTDYLGLELRGRLDRLDEKVHALESRRTPSGAELLGHVVFELNSATVDETARRELQAIVAAGGAGARYRVQGFADATGGYAANLALSQRRADAVAEVLKSLGAGRVVAVGSGRTDGFGPTPADNRRVTITGLDERAP